MRKAYPSYNTFTERFSHVLAQFEIDKEPITQAGFEWDKHAFNSAAFSVLNGVHADRVAVEGKGFTHTQSFTDGVKKMKMYRTVISIRLEYLIKETGSETAAAAFRGIKQGRTQLDVVRDVLALVSVLREFSHITGGIKPSGIEVNDGYLDMVASEADELLHTEGEAHTSDSPRSILVEKQNRLITLCMNCYDEMRLFASGAFAINPEYYRDNYTFKGPSDNPDQVEDLIIEDGEILNESE